MSTSLVFGTCQFGAELSGPRVWGGYGWPSCIKLSTSASDVVSISPDPNTARVLTLSVRDHGKSGPVGFLGALGKTFSPESDDDRPLEREFFQRSFSQYPSHEAAPW